MHTTPLLFATTLATASLFAQNQVPQGDFQATPTTWTMAAFNDPLGTTGLVSARVQGHGPSLALAADFQTLNSVRSATWRGAPFALTAGVWPVGFAVSWEKQVTPPIPYPTVNRVELRLYDANNVVVSTVTLNSPNQTGLIERAAFAGTVNIASADTFTPELFLRHSNLAGIPFTCAVDDVFIGSPDGWYFAAGCAGSGAFTPVPGVTEAPLVGSSNFALSVHDTFGPTLAFFLMDVSNTSAGGLALPFALGGGCDLLVGTSVLLPAAVTGVGNGVGTASQLLPIPASPGLANVVLYAQWGVADPGAPNPFGLAMTAGFGFRIR
ncbi:MAG: hypothetical protein IPK26_08265 [Planctomycetes bacterium]|nr:hypothetical protein [Planctomycetota bacterium]